MKIDLKNMTRKELEKLRADIDKALAKANEADRRAAAEAAEKAAQAFGFSLKDLTGAAPAKTKAAPKAAKSPRAGRKLGKVAPKYRNPENASETWTGRGRAPRWLAAAEAAGKSREDFKI